VIPLTSPERQNEKLNTAMEKALQRALVHSAGEASPEVVALENEYAQKCGFTYGVGLASLPDSLVLSLRAVGLERDDEVVVPAYGYSAAALAVLWAGMKPVFADICPQTGVITAETVKTAITKRTRAVIALDLYGRKPAIGKIREVCDYFGLFLIEEATHAPGLPSKGTKAHIHVSGFGPDTPISAAGFAAIACVSDALLAQRLKDLSRAAHVGKFSESRVSTRSQIDPFQAAILRTKLTQSNLWLAMRRTVAGWYQKAFYPYTHPERLRLTAPAEGPEMHAWTYFPLRVPNQREPLRRHLLARGIAADVLFPKPLPQVPPFDALSTPRRYPGAELWCQEILLLPTFAELSAREVEVVIGSVVQWLNPSCTSFSFNP
jgi:dTDP-4-amino-4,6-dideoxygalactose transaminase